MKMLKVEDLEKNQKILSRKEGTDFLLFNPASRQIVFLKKEAYEIWSSLGEEEKKGGLSDEFDTDSDIFQSFLKNLVDKKLVYVKK